MENSASSFLPCSRAWLEGSRIPELCSLRPTVAEDSRVPVKLITLDSWPGGLPAGLQTHSAQRSMLLLVRRAADALQNEVVTFLSCFTDGRYRLFGGRSPLRAANLDAEAMFIPGGWSLARRAPPLRAASWGG